MSKRTLGEAVFLLVVFQTAGEIRRKAPASARRMPKFPATTSAELKTGIELPEEGVVNSDYLTRQLVSR